MDTEERPKTQDRKARPERTLFNCSGGAECWGPREEHGWTRAWRENFRRNFFEVKVTSHEINYFQVISVQHLEHSRSCADVTFCQVWENTSSPQAVSFLSLSSDPTDFVCSFVTQNKVLAVLLITSLYYQNLIPSYG